MPSYRYLVRFISEQLHSTIWNDAYHLNKIQEHEKVKFKNIKTRRKKKRVQVIDCNLEIGG